MSFTVRIVRIARVCQFGRKDRAERSAPGILYEQHELLSFTDMDLDIIRGALLTKLTQ